MSELTDLRPKLWMDEANFLSRQNTPCRSFVSELPLRDEYKTVARR